MGKMKELWQQQQENADQDRPTQEELHSKGESCEEPDCQDCCEHNEHDHYICLDCGHEGEASDYYDEDYGKDR